MPGLPPGGGAAAGREVCRKCRGWEQLQFLQEISRQKGLILGKCNCAPGFGRQASQHMVQNFQGQNQV